MGSANICSGWLPNQSSFPPRVQTPLCSKIQKTIYSKQQHPNFLPTNQQLGTTGVQIGQSNTLQQQPEISKVTLNRLSPGSRSFLEQEGMLVQPQHCSTRDTPNIPYAAEKRGKPVSGREHNNALSAVKGRASRGLLLHCGGVSREAKPRKTHQDRFAHTLTNES